MAHQRGEYGSTPRVGATASDLTTPWWKYAIGASVILGVVGIGVVVSRSGTVATADWPECSVPKIVERRRSAGIKPWMGQAEIERLWLAYNVKHGRPARVR